MPKLIDRDGRRREIAEAVWRIVVRDGVSAVSIRDVAAEAGLAVGSVRHVFSTKAELLQYSMALVHEQARERVQKHFALQDPRKLAEAVLAEMMPLDDHRRVEMAVNMAVVTESPSDPSLRRVALDAQHAVADACRGVLAVLQHAKLIRDDVDLDYEADRLHALVDGLALHALTVDSKDLRPRALLDLLRTHLADLEPTGRRR
ncbi:TetR family transcriptional regulator [Mycolicibacterium celeriflavum]|uniref:HTH-type transcriptional regulator PksA n=1 Tax=Mycolicibacterium celeriflavum TaxID=1249101 RepID=A0A1X0BPZ5_MYCCF|nr:TetR family transcriptional regulator C-terminal domain-containing protein [Mycolicibacterium celeriflavum]MCV7240066.1 TetR family transcriptional regulator C-terminal domain-containing protein [Mycolicibacterium celeriflavum]OBG19472.1 TetR family transcriptional regulator [Mycolicibacterium celeriflavum]ORA45360.1 TetR family transcriptional regulator [Mycolicibacterium celeriflavum]BBY42641.1 HTH-type transcriptional regulator PksA [Mycolicibacterium celeriflavum]